MRFALMLLLVLLVVLVLLPVIVMGLMMGGSTGFGMMAPCGRNYTPAER